MDYSNYDVCQMRLGGIGSIFYLDAMDIIKPLESKDKIVAEKLVKRLKLMQNIDGF